MHSSKVERVCPTCVGQHKWVGSWHGNGLLLREIIWQALSGLCRSYKNEDVFQPNYLPFVNAPTEPSPSCTRLLFKCPTICFTEASSSPPSEPRLFTPENFPKMKDDWGHGAPHSGVWAADTTQVLTLESTTAQPRATSHRWQLSWSLLPGVCPNPWSPVSPVLPGLCFPTHGKSNNNKGKLWLLPSCHHAGVNWSTLQCCEISFYLLLLWEESQGVRRSVEHSGMQ